MRWLITMESPFRDPHRVLPFRTSQKLHPDQAARGRPTCKQILSCVVAERYWDPVRWAIQNYGWMFEDLPPSRGIESGDGADPSVATMASTVDPAR